MKHMTSEQRLALRPKLLNSHFIKHDQEVGGGSHQCQGDTVLYTNKI